MNEIMMERDLLGKDHELPGDYRFPECREVIEKEREVMIKFITDSVNPQVSSDLFSGRYSRKQILERAEKVIEKPLSTAEARIAEKCNKPTTEPPKPHRVRALVMYRYFGIIEQEVVVGIGLRDRMNALETSDPSGL